MSRKSNRQTVRAVVAMWFVAAAALFSCGTPVYAAPPTVEFRWQHNGSGVTGFRIYKGASPQTLLKLADLPPDARSFTWAAAEPALACFGVSAVGELGESEILSTRADGGAACLGKPQAPTGFTYSVQ